MKFLFLLGVLCLATAKSVPAPKYDHTLKDSLDDFLKLVDINKVIPIVLEGITGDEQVMDALTFLQSENFIKIVVKVQSMPNFKNTLNALNELGLDVYYYLNSLADVMGWPEIWPKEIITLDMAISRTLIGFIEKIKAALPLDEMKALYEDKMKNDDVFIKAMEIVGSKEFNEIGDVVQAMDEWKLLLKRLQDVGVDTDKLLKEIMDFFGWH